MNLLFCWEDATNMQIWGVFSMKLVAESQQEDFRRPGEETQGREDQGLALKTPPEVRV